MFNKNKTEQLYKLFGIELKKGLLMDPNIAKDILQLGEDGFRLLMQSYYNHIKKVLEKYVVMPVEHYELVATWILGTYFHEHFNSYPFLFFNAMKGSGKTRTLRIISTYSNNGKLIGAPTEATLFRLSKGRTLCIDEFENIGSKEKSVMRELLNAAYKQGMYVERLKKISVKGIEEYVGEKFDVYCAIAMANIWGMDNILGDRCIKICLEKSSDNLKTRLIDIMKLEDKERLNLYLLTDKNVINIVSNIISGMAPKWNYYVIAKYKKTDIDLHPNLTNLFDKIYNSGMAGRILELFLPLFFIASYIDNDLVNNLIKFAIKYHAQRIDEDTFDSKDILLTQFLNERNFEDYVRVKDLCDMFCNYLDQPEAITPIRLGFALKRLNVIIDKIRHSEGFKVKIDMAKVKRLAANFQPLDVNANRPERCKKCDAKLDYEHYENLEGMCEVCSGEIDRVKPVVDIEDIGRFE